MLGMHPHHQTVPHGHHVPTHFSPLTPPSQSTNSGSSSCVTRPSLVATGLPKPKLSLNTSFNAIQPRTFGKGSGSGLRLDTLSAISPTVRNTFSNAYERANSSLNPIQPTNTPDGADDDSARPSPCQIHSSGSSISSASTLSLESGIIPYTVAAHPRSILSNSFFPKPVRRSTMSIQQHRPLFPPEKRVSFRAPLDEEITTTKYTLAHSDISDPEPSADSVSADSDSSATTTPRPSSPTPTQTPTLLTPPQLQKPVLVLPQLDFTFSAPLPTSSPPRSRPHRRDNSTTSPLLLCPRARPHKRDSSTSSDGSEASLASSDSDNSIAHTPVAGRSKRCKWTWTLGPLPGDPHPSDDFLESREGSVEIESLVCSPVDPLPTNHSSLGELLQSEEPSTPKNAEVPIMDQSEEVSTETMDIDSGL